MDFMDENSDSGNIESSSSNLCYGVTLSTQAVDGDLGDSLGSPYNLGCQANQDSEALDLQTNWNPNTPQSNPQKFVSSEDTICSKCIGAVEPFCHVNLDSLLKLKDSTRKLLCLVEEIQAKMVSKNSVRNNSNQFCLSDLLKSNPISTPKPSKTVSSLTDLVGASALKRLETQTKDLETITLETEEDDCSIYKRLTRKCHCLNKLEYNDLIIHFNETSRYFTSTLGEIIKNMRIVKKFIFIGGYYTKNALMFLNEGLARSTHFEKVDIILGCSHADVCDVFDEQSIVVTCIVGTRAYDSHEDPKIQTLTASLIHKLAQIEEGRRYLNFSSKIANDIKKVLRKKPTKVGDDVLESLNSALNLMHPSPLSQQANVTYYCKPVDEASRRKPLTPLLQYREYMTIEEVLNHLGLLKNFSNNDSGKSELITCLPTLLDLFKQMLIEYDNSKINIIITNILNNVVSRNMVKKQETAKAVAMTETATEPIEMKSECNQIPMKKNCKQKRFKSTLRLNTLSLPNTRRNPSKTKNPKTFSVIVVPIEKKLNHYNSKKLYI